MDGKKRAFRLVQEVAALDEKYDETVDFLLKERPDNGFAVQLVFEELFVNVINHAYRQEGKGPVMVVAEKVGEDLIIVMIDIGIPFDPVERANWVSPATETGGKGLNLVKAYSKQFEYKNAFNANVVRVVI